MNELYDSWLRIVPLEIYSTPAQLKTTLSLQMGIKCTWNTDWAKPDSQFDATKLFVTKIANQINANIVAVSTYADASTIIKKNFADKNLLWLKKSKIKMSIFGIKNAKMVIALELMGSLNGTVYLLDQKYNENHKKYTLINLNTY
jgi:hypothetical protein